MLPLKVNMKFYFFFLLLIISSIGNAQIPETKFEMSGGKETPPYFEIIQWWQEVEKADARVKVMEMRPTDAGYPLHLVLISADKNFGIQSTNKSIILVNNGIHSGEPDGIDASMLLARDILKGEYHLPENILLAIIPVYNIGGSLNRSENYRIDQNGPEAFGFRGNAQNLDLNRDFIKCDSKTALSFIEIFHRLNPDVFIDNHVSNGADYQHIMTLLTSQYNKLGGNMGTFLHTQFEPAIYKEMKKHGYALIPYAGSFGDSPSDGWSAFWDSPRYSSGYATLWNTFAFVPETHMLKPYAQRVASTLALMKTIIDFTSNHSGKIEELRKKAFERQSDQQYFPIKWELDSSIIECVYFKGFRDTMVPSKVSGLPRLYYDRSQPYEMEVPYFSSFRVTDSVRKPMAYIIPQGWWKVTDRLKANHVKMRQLTLDTTIEVQGYRIAGYQSLPRPYEGHHLNYDVSTEVFKKRIYFHKGDWYIPMNQKANRFLIATLEPTTRDSYFAWNFFDPILQQKEGFSAYHFEDIAAEYLDTHPELRKQLEEAKKTNPELAKSARRQLHFVFKHSPWMEPAYMRYPVYRVVE